MKDYYLGTIIGFLVGWLILLPAINLGLVITPLVIISSVVGFTFLGPLALGILNFLSRFWKILAQFGKFAAVGTLNTLLDLGVLNLLIFFTNIAVGVYFSVFKVISFLVAATNSYFWNKFWIFQNYQPVTTSEYLKFFLFTLGGAFINVSVASFIVNEIGAPTGVNSKMWANIAAVVAALAGMLWNFFSYRHIVFRQSVK